MCLENETFDTSNCFIKQPQYMQHFFLVSRLPTRLFEHLNARIDKIHCEQKTIYYIPSSELCSRLPFKQSSYIDILCEVLRSIEESNWRLITRYHHPWHPWVIWRKKHPITIPIRHYFERPNRCSRVLWLANIHNLSKNINAVLNHISSMNCSIFNFGGCGILSTKEEQSAQLSEPWSLEQRLLIQQVESLITYRLTEISFRFVNKSPSAKLSKQCFSSEKNFAQHNRWLLL